MASGMLAGTSPHLDRMTPIKPPSLWNYAALLLFAALATFLAFAIVLVSQ
jgi:hypothetical protein